MFPVITDLYLRNCMNSPGLVKSQTTVDQLTRFFIKLKIMAESFVPSWTIHDLVKVRLAPNIFDLAPNFPAPKEDHL